MNLHVSNELECVHNVGEYVQPASLNFQGESEAFHEQGITLSLWHSFALAIGVRDV